MVFGTKNDSVVRGTRNTSGAGGVSQDRRAAKWEKLSENLPSRRRVEDEDVPRIQIHLMIRKDSVLRYQGTMPPQR